MRFSERLVCWFVVMACALRARVVVCQGGDEMEDRKQTQYGEMPGGNGETDSRVESEREIDEPDVSGKDDEGEILSGRGELRELEEKIPNSFALVYWAGAAAPDAGTNEDYVTVGSFIAQSVIVCIPSAKIPITIQNVSNWYVHHVMLFDKQPPTKIRKEELVLFFHPGFKMTRDSTHRIAMIILDPEGSAKTLGVIPLSMTAVPFLPSLMLKRTDDYALTMCSMVVHTGVNTVVQIPFVVTSCRFTKKGLAIYREKVCGYTKMMKDTTRMISEGRAYPDDMGAPLVCGSVLVGVYAGIQDVDGTRYTSTAAAVELGNDVLRETLASDEQFTFEMPGALENYEFLSAFSDKEGKKMSWTMKIDMDKTDECAGEMDLRDEDLAEDVGKEGGYERTAGGPEENGTVAEGPEEHGATAEKPEEHGTAAEGPEEHGKAP